MKSYKLDAEKLESLLREASEMHNEYEARTGKDDNWPNWYAQYITMRLNQPGELFDPGGTSNIVTNDGEVIPSQGPFHAFP